MQGLPGDFQIVSRICPALSSGPSPPFCLFSQPHRVEITVQPCAFYVQEIPISDCFFSERHLRVRGGLLREPLREMLPGGCDRRQGTENQMIIVSECTFNDFLKTLTRQRLGQLSRIVNARGCSCPRKTPLHWPNTITGTLHGENLVN